MCWGPLLILDLKVGERKISLPSTLNSAGKLRYLLASGESQIINTESKDKQVTVLNKYVGGQQLESNKYYISSRQTMSISSTLWLARVGFAIGIGFQFRHSS